MFEDQYPPTKIGFAAAVRVAGDEWFHSKALDARARADYLAANPDGLSLVHMRLATKHSGSRRWFQLNWFVA